MVVIPSIKTAQPPQKGTDKITTVDTITDTNIPDTDTTTNTDITDIPSGGQSVTAVDGIHHEMYYAIENAFIEYFMTMDEFKGHFREMFGCTYDKTYRGLCEYYGITKDEYVAYWEMMREDFNKSHFSEIWDFEYLFILETNYDEWFLDDYESNDVFLSDAFLNRVTDKQSIEAYVAPERNESYTIRYYTIDRKLIDHVGTDDFNEYLKTTEDINIISFLGSFDIDKDAYMEIYKDNVVFPYNPEYLFSTDLTDEYFKVHKDLRIQ